MMDGTPTKPIGPVDGHGIKWTVAKTILTMTSVNEPIIIFDYYYHRLYYYYNIPHSFVTALVTGIVVFYSSIIAVIGII